MGLSPGEPGFAGVPGPSGGTGLSGRPGLVGSSGVLGLSGTEGFSGAPEPGFTGSVGGAGCCAKSEPARSAAETVVRMDLELYFISPSIAQPASPRGQELSRLSAQEADRAAETR